MKEWFKVIYKYVIDSNKYFILVYCESYDSRRQITMTSYVFAILLVLCLLFELIFLSINNFNASMIEMWFLFCSSELKSQFIKKT